MSQPGRNSSDLAATHERLESWKEIAAYLKRSVRTVQGWEKKEGLPVHRHLHDKQGTVYAYRDELDAWWRSRRPQLELMEESQTGTRRLWWMVAAGALTVLVIAVAAWRTYRSPALAFAQRDWVLVANFENRTGDAAIEGVLENALERELSSSRFVNVVPRERVEDTLRLMKKPLMTPVGDALGREICLRDGGIRALIRGRVEKLDSTYLLTASIVEPGIGRTVKSFGEEARGQEELPRALRRLSSLMREAFGEQPAQIRKTEQELERVTTPSLAALKEYSRALRIAWQGNWAQATEFLERALREDSEFASAHGLLARCYGRIGKPELEAFHHERARDLAEAASDRERYFILAGYYEGKSREVGKAALAYELLLKEFPDDLWGVNCLSLLYQGEGQFLKAVPIEVRFANLRPNDAGANLGAGRALAIWADNRAQAEPYLQRARELISSGASSPARAGMFAYLWLELLPVYDHWARGEPEKALAILESVHKKLMEIPEVKAYPLVEHYLANAYMTLGRLRQGEALYAAPPPDRRGEGPLLIALYRGDTAAARAEARAYFRRRPTIHARMLLAAVGLASEAERGLSAEIPPNAWALKILHGQIGVARGKWDEAIPLLEDGVAHLRPWGDGRIYFAAAALAEAWEKQSNLPRAIQALEAASREKQRSASSGYAGPHYWMWSQARLAQLYRKAGRAEEAAKVEAELRRMLELADSDHAILRELRTVTRAGVESPVK